MSHVEFAAESGGVMWAVQDGKRVGGVAINLQPGEYHAFIARDDSHPDSGPWKRIAICSHLPDAQTVVWQAVTDGMERLQI